MSESLEKPSEVPTPLAPSSPADPSPLSPEEEVKGREEDRDALVEGETALPPKVSEFEPLPVTSINADFEEYRERQRLIRESRLKHEQMVDELMPKPKKAKGGKGKNPKTRVVSVLKPAAGEWYLMDHHVIQMKVKC